MTFVPPSDEAELPRRLRVPSRRGGCLPFLRSVLPGRRRPAYPEDSIAAGDTAADAEAHEAEAGLPKQVSHLESSRAIMASDPTEPVSPTTPTRQRAPLRLQKTKVKLNNNSQQEVAGRRIDDRQHRCPIIGPASQVAAPPRNESQSKEGYRRLSSDAGAPEAGRSPSLEGGSEEMGEESTHTGSSVSKQFVY